jgi:formylglycine-generating enzyme required for sulfatase activity
MRLRNRPLQIWLLIVAFSAFSLCICVIHAQDPDPRKMPPAKASVKILLVGNQAYQHLPEVKTAVNDVRALDSAFRQLGFAPSVLINLASQTEQTEKLDAFAATVGPSDVVLFYYAGRGTGDGDADFLFPLDYDLGDMADGIEFHAYSIGRLIGNLKTAQGRIIILDASHPVPGSHESTGLVALTVDRGTAIMFSTALNKASLPEGADATTSAFAQSFMAALKKPGLTLQQFFDNVSNAVYSAGSDQPYNATGGGFVSFAFREAPLSGPATKVPRQNPKDKQDYVWIPTGEFTMGCTEGDQKCKPDETPPHSVQISKGFWMGKKEVTVSEYERYIKQQDKKMPKAPTQNKNWNKDDFPMVEVTWSDAASFCSWAGGRLPTEAEWEYAARADTKTIYPWGNEIVKDNAKYFHTFLGKQNQGNDLWPDFAPVGQYEQNSWGLLDVVGNVWEWCSDWYQKLYDPGPVDPKGPQTGSERVLRGGAYNSSDVEVRLSSRGKGKPDDHNNTIGFRCAIDNWPN